MTALELLGRIMRSWKGTHRWMRRKVNGYMSACARCGAVRAIKHRKQGETK